MSTDAGEKLLQEYFAFGGEEENQVAGVATQAQGLTPAHGWLKSEEDGEPSAVNSSALTPYYAPFALHFNPASVEAGDDSADGEASAWEPSRRARDVVARLLQRRQYACPTGMSNCSSIGYPYSCCQAGLQCIQITDTGLGPVGCCPDGDSCSGSIACSGSEQGRAELNRYSSSGNTDEHSYLDSWRFSNDRRGHRHRHGTHIREHYHERNNHHHFFLLLFLHHHHNTALNINNVANYGSIDLNINNHHPQRPSPPNLHQHNDNLHHLPSRLLPNRLLRLLSRLRRRVLPDRARLPDPLLPDHRVHDHHLQRPDSRRAPDGRPLPLLLHHRVMRGRVVAVSVGRRGRDFGLLPVWV
ncbi:hypothetical protein VPNG_05478 [Cytospora leucostoma]|uniref:Uncharacterized protein n=1 Tax=Cytospora leucostoma TaxID=1230097 RepID=A0A423XBQ6_9PEZI|nr:hypothetical protein VPNG_05478 [Cytospora leucostoma]